jgi:hypothetical protein
MAGLAGFLDDLEYLAREVQKTRHARRQRRGSKIGEGHWRCALTRTGSV